MWILPSFLNFSNTIQMYTIGVPLSPMKGGVKGEALSAEGASSSCFLRTRYKTKERGIIL